MPSNIVIPSVGESITTGVIGRWNKKDGDAVTRDEIVLELETDKVTMEVRAESGGILRHRAKQGDTVAVGAVVGIVEEGGTVAASPATAPAAATPVAKATPAPAPAAAPVAASASTLVADVRATPLAKRTAADMGVDLSKIPATGIGHRVREKDVIDFLQSKAPASAAPAATPAAAPSSTGPRGTTREPMSQLRKRIATRLVEAQHTAAMLTTFNEVDMSAVMALRTQYKEEFEKKHGIGLGFMSFFVKASVHALKAFPLINSYIVEGASGPEIEKHDYMDIALAVSTPKGLLVPVLRNCQSLTMAKIESSIKDFAIRGKEGKIGVDELQGGTFTITNGGVFGSLMSTPILNPPQSAILGMHAIKNRPVEDPRNAGQIALRPMMYLALSYDHRIVDGAEAVQFLVTIKKCIEDPTRLLMEI